MAGWRSALAVMASPFGISGGIAAKGAGQRYSRLNNYLKDAPNSTLDSPDSCVMAKKKQSHKLHRQCQLPLVFSPTLRKKREGWGTLFHRTRESA
jgi:hypothetical protein